MSCGGTHFYHREIGDGQAGFVSISLATTVRCRGSGEPKIMAG